MGVSRQVSEDTIMLNTFYGTPLYLSPELVENQPYNEKTDIWSLGIILYEMACLRLPFRGVKIHSFYNSSSFSTISFSNHSYVTGETGSER